MAVFNRKEREGKTRKEAQRGEKESTQIKEKFEIQYTRSQKIYHYIINNDKT